jgi:O-antigen/teichoic acid export membrane protein
MSAKMLGLRARIESASIKLVNDSLFRNSLYLMLSTGAMAGFGFFFWIICSHLFTPSELGIATTLISAMTLISYVSLLGFNNTFIRFLPTSDDKNNEINTGLLLSTIGAIVLASLYILFVPIVAPKLGILHQNIFYAIGFIVIATFATLNLLTDSIFIAFRAAKYNLLVDGFILSLTKLGLPFVFVTLGAYGIFAASGSAAAVAMTMSIYFLVKKFDYRPHLKLHLPTLQKVFRYSFGNYVANILNIAPTLLLPLIVLNHLGSAAAGYYFLAFTIANLLYAVVYATSQSLFAEGSYAEHDLKKLIRRSVLVMGSILLFGLFILLFLSPFVLNIFGKSYATEATSTLQIFALASIAVALYIFNNLILRIQKRIYALIAVNALYFVSISGLAYLWVDNGLVWIGYAWLAGNLLTGIFSLLLLLRKNH